MELGKDPRHEVFKAKEPHVAAVAVPSSVPEPTTSAPRPWRRRKAKENESAEVVKLAPTPKATREEKK